MIKNWFIEYKRSLKAIEIEEIPDLIFYRPIAFLFVKTIYKTNITPNQITLTAMLLGVIGGCVAMIGGKEAFQIAGLLYIMFNILDCSDGQLARIKKNGTLTGRIIDGVADYIVGIFMYLGFLIGHNTSITDPIYWWLAIVLAGLSNTIHSMLIDHQRLRFNHFALGEPLCNTIDTARFSDERDRLRKLKEQLLNRIILTIYLHYASRQGKIARVDQSFRALESVPTQAYYKANRPLMWWWTILGPTMQITIMSLSAIFFVPEFYTFWMIVPMNILTLALVILQKRVDRNLIKTYAN